MLDLYLGYTEEELKLFLCKATLWGLLSFSICITTKSFFREYMIKIIIVPRDSQN